MIEERGADNGKKESEADPTPAEEAAPPVPLVAHVPVPPIPEHQIGSDSAGDKTACDAEKPKKILVEVLKDDELRPFEASTLNWARWGFFLAALTLVVFYCQLREAQHQTRILSDQADDSSQDARIARRQTRRQIRIGQEQLEAVTWQMQVDQRAWVSAEVKGNTANGIYTGFTVTLVNTGKTPAIGVEIAPWLHQHTSLPRTRSEFAKERANALAAYKKEDRIPAKRKMMEADGRVHPQGFPLGPNAESTPVPYPHPELLEPVEIPEIWNYFQWYITYKDIFGSDHETWFCYRVFPSSEPVICPSENGMN